MAKQIKRKKYLEQLVERERNGFIKVITGIRRCGKSYLLNTIFYNHLLKSGVEKNHIIKFAFDSADDLLLIGENLLELEKENRKVNPEKFMAYIKKQVKGRGVFYLLLDEVQRLGSFEAVLNGYLRKNNMDIYVTGSNSKFLSSDIIDEFEGRGDEIHVLPLSFSEYFAAVGGAKDFAFEDYMIYGGLPAVALMKTDQQKSSYLKTQIQNVYLKDIVKRFALKSDDDIGELLDIIASGISSLTNPRKLSDTFRSVKKSALSAITVKKYIEHFEDAFMIDIVRRFDVKGKRYIETPYKIYFEDVGLRNARLNFRQVEATHILENIIYNELRFRGYEVDVGVVPVREKAKSGHETKKLLEIDFVANKGARRYYIQSAYSIVDEAKWIQETKSFDKIADSFKKILIVEKSIKPRLNERGYAVMGVKEFLLNENSLGE